MKNLKTIHDLFQKINGFFFRQFFMFFHIVFHISIIAKLQNKIMIFLRFEILIKMHDIWMFYFNHNSYLCFQQFFSLTIGFQFIFTNCFYGEDLLRIRLQIRFINVSELSLPQKWGSHIVPYLLMNLHDIVLIFKFIFHTLIFLLFF